MYRAGVSRSWFRSVDASAATCSRSRSERARASPESGGSAGLFERVFQLGKKIVDALDADREAHQALIDAQAAPHVLG